LQATRGPIAAHLRLRARPHPRFDTGLALLLLRRTGLLAGLLFHDEKAARTVPRRRAWNADAHAEDVGSF
jgi:hypothetical protein